MNRTTTLIAASAIALALVLGTLAVAVNLGALRAAQGSVGQLDPEPITVVVDPPAGSNDAPTVVELVPAPAPAPVADGPAAAVPAEYEDDEDDHEEYEDEDHGEHDEDEHEDDEHEEHEEYEGAEDDD